MKYNPAKHHRRSIRLKGYDYHKAGAYFVTICTKNRICVLDDPIVTGVIQSVWRALPKWFPTIELDEFVVMPNHIHFVLWIVESHLGTSLANVQIPTMPENGDGGEPHPYKIPTPQKTNQHPSLGDVVGTFKSLVFTVYLDWIQQNDPTRRAKFWQGNYYEHIVRSERELNNIRQYIIDNPRNWSLDRDNCDNSRRLPPAEKIDDYLEDLEEFVPHT